MISKKTLTIIKNSSPADFSYYVYNTVLGKITIACNKETIIAVNFGAIEEFGECKPTQLTDRAAQQLNEYFTGERQIFDIPIYAEGTPFQKLVWNALQTIPYGQTRSYKEIAVMIGKPKACRAVGMANNKNPISIIIPCHRVIGSDGSLTGYGGGLSIKKYLLALEQNTL